MVSRLSRGRIRAELLLVVSTTSSAVGHDSGAGFERAGLLSSLRLLVDVVELAR